jgi:hypothetical protein
MHRLRSAGRIFLWAFACVLIVTFVTVLSIRVHLYVLRHRAELLLADVESITLRQATFHDVQPIFLRWRRWGKFDGPCSEARCTFDVSLSEIDTPLNRFLYDHNRLINLAARFGERPTGIRAEFTVLNGLVWSEGIAFGIENSGWYPDGRPNIEMTSGEATSVSKIEPRVTADWHWRLRPDYTIRWPDNLPNQVRLQFTPFANFVDIHRLMSLNFSCLTRSVPCTHKEDIMPKALAQVAYWTSLPDDAGDRKTFCDDPLALELLARDSRNIVIATVSAKRLILEYGGEPGVRASRKYRRLLILQERLKNRAESKALLKLFVLENPAPEVLYRPGDRVILFYKDDGFNAYSITGCSPLAVTPPHLSAVRRGIAEDTRPAGLPDHAFQLSGSVQ